MPEFFIAPGGLRLIVEELPHTYSVSLGCFIGAGARHEAPACSGAAHFIEHMLFKGSQHYPNARTISQTIEGVGGLLNASTAYESTVYYTKVATIHFDRAAQLLGDMLLHPLFELHELEKERRVIIEELRGLQDVPGDWVHDLLQQTMWAQTPLGRDIAGSVETVSAISRNDLAEFWQRHYNRSNMVVSVAGNIRAERVAECVGAAFMPMSDGLPTAPQAVPVPVSGPRLTLMSRDTEQGNFCFGLPGLAYNDPDRRPLQVLDSILGGGMSSRLFQLLREDHGLAYHVGSYHNELSDTGMWVVYGSVEPEALRDAIALVLEMLRELVHYGVTDDELGMVKEQVKGGLLLSLEDTWSVASRNGAHLLRYGHVMPVEQVVAEVEAVTAEDVRRVAKRLIRNDSLHVAVIGPYNDEDSRDLEVLVAEALL
ncbi:M16 family metallopeptidase [Candidatus Viridilinea mediisalina]|uniref:Peptidase M16 n=1 Tax=Candidatus Viridilinea mediisalina TaxID=2024553 RepID=A0A2A6RPQ1_9CHLR|nr:pitrilysin family protein [Candidatus Viridilinea mediisalina]PDW04905.1 peptidase M16 [Candidatus Viridilinea mediisalina]